MNDSVNFHNNPLHGVSLQTVVTELVDHYGYEILYAYLQINCFNKRPSIESSVKFLKKSEWAREKVEAFYLYTYKNLPRASDSEFVKPPRDRIVPDGDKPRRPKLLSLDDAAERQKRKEEKAVERRNGGGRREGGRGKPSGKDFAQRRVEKKRKADGSIDPWGNAKL